MWRLAREIGDFRFPFEASVPEDVVRDHPHIGHRAEVTPFAQKYLRKYRGKRGKVTGVLLRGVEIGGYEVCIKKGPTLYGTVRDFFVDRQYVEDVYLNTPRAQSVQEILHHWRKPRHYYGGSCAGLEAFHFEIAKVTDILGIEYGSSYRYPSSVREQDGWDWRLVIPDRNRAVVINCHSVWHDYSWSLVTTTHSTRDVQLSGTTLIGDEDHWSRTLLWTREVGEILGFDIRSVVDRLDGNVVLRALRDVLLPETIQQYIRLTGRAPAVGSELPSIGFSTVRVRPGSIGVHEKATDVMPYSVITVAPKAAKNYAYLREVVKHEIIHYVLSPMTSSVPHTKLFRALADAMGLPRVFQD